LKLGRRFFLLKKDWPTEKGKHILDVGEEEAVPVPEMVADVPPGLPEGDPAPDPPAFADNWANPTDGGEERNTEYTFF
jgi:hypothetical protein